MRALVHPGEGAASAASEGQPALNPQRGVPGAERMAVYAEGYRARAEEALREVYEAIRHVVGARAFAALTRAYTQAHPSQDYNLSVIGRHLQAFLSTYPLTRDLPFLPDLARLEWAVSQAFHAQESPPLDAASLAALSPDDWHRLRLPLQPAVQVVASAWPILDIWQARQAPREAVQITVVDRPQWVLVFRRGWAVQCRLLAQDQAAVLTQLREGRTLGDVCDALAASGPPPPLTDWFAGWARDGLITGLAIV